MQLDDDILSLFGAYKEAYLQKRLQYASFAQYTRRYLFIETPKAACSTMKWLLAALEGGSVFRRPVKPESTLGMCIHNRRLHPVKNIFHLTKPRALELLTAPDAIRFCVVRNPYARLVSAWSDKVRQVEPGYAPFCRKIILATRQAPPLDAMDTPNFAEFAGFITSRHDPKACNPHWQEMKSLLMPDAIRYTHVLKTEQLARDFAPVLAWIAPGQSAAALLAAARTNESLPVAWRQVYDQSLADLVYRFYEEDFVQYGYDRESWKAGFDEGPAGIPATDIEKRALMAIRSRNEVIGILYDRIDELSKELKQFQGGENTHS